jgi:hypothetical protein
MWQRISLSARPSLPLRIVITVTALLLFPLGSAFAQSGTGPNEPAGATQMMDCSFDDPVCGGGLWDVYSSANIANVDGPISPSGAMDAALYPCGGGACSGGVELIWPPNQAAARPLKELYVSFWWRTNPQFQGNVVGGNKLFFMRANNFVFDGTRTNGTFLMSGPPNSSSYSIIFSHNTGTLDNSHTCAKDLGLICYPNVSTTPIIPGQWYNIEAYVKASSCETCRDGIVRWWVNGELNGDYTDMNYGTGIVNEFVWGNTWDGYPNGNGCCPTTEWHHYVDHLYISAPDCPDGCPVTGGAGGSGGGTGGTYKPRQVHTKYINKRPGEVAELNHKSNRNFFQIYGVPPICSLSAGTFNSTSQAWELTKAEMDTVKLTCPPEFCGSVSLTVLSLKNKDSLSGSP